MKRLTPAAALMASSYFFMGQKKQRPAFADPNVYSCSLKSGFTMNPKFDKRHKEGEDMYLVHKNFICCLDGVGGWIEVFIDSGIMTK